MFALQKSSVPRRSCTASCTGALKHLQAKHDRVVDVVDASTGDDQAHSALPRTGQNRQVFIDFTALHAAKPATAL
jgi:hypothetical protein